jgi:hypothetical protein
MIESEFAKWEFPDVSDEVLKKIAKGSGITV